MEGIPDHPSGRIFMDRLQKWSGRLGGIAHLAKAGGGPRGCDRGARGTVASGARGRKTPRANPELPAEADRAA
jgi:hypothetical protein